MNCINGTVGFAFVSVILKASMERRSNNSSGLGEKDFGSTKGISKFNYLMDARNNLSY